MANQKNLLLVLSIDREQPKLGQDIGCVKNGVDNMPASLV